MVARLVFIFSVITLIVLAVKKGMSPNSEPIQRVPGYPEPVALKTFKPISDAEYLAKLPSARDYALSFSSAPELPIQQVQAPKPVKRTVAAKKRIRLAKRFMKR